MYRYRLNLWRDDIKFNLKLKSTHNKQHTTYGAFLNYKTAPILKYTDS